jgi:chemosensory pili system protein ChpA (sensor histidine kinase/response regulator)
MAAAGDAFSLGDVRETFVADITHSIQTIESAMAQASAWSRECGQLRAAAVAQALTAAADQGHTMVGTSSLVGVGSLVATGDTFQRLATAAELLAFDIVELAQQLERLCAGGMRLASDARTVLELELSGKPREATSHAAEAITALKLDHLPAVERERESALMLENEDDELPIQEAPAEQGALQAPTTIIRATKADADHDVPMPELFDFSEDEARIEASEGMSVVIVPEEVEVVEVEDDCRAVKPPSPAESSPATLARAMSDPHRAGGRGIDEETHEIFLQEAYDLLEQLDRLCLDWHADSAEEARRLYHTIKGAAATVGEEHLRDAAHAVEDRLEQGPLPTADVLLMIQRRMRERLAQDPSHGGAIDCSGLFDAATGAIGTAPAARAGSPVSPGQAIPSVLPIATSRALASGPTPAGAVAMVEAVAAADLLEPERDAQDFAAMAEPQRSLRVPAERLDHLLAMAGELLLGRNKVEDRVQTLVNLQHELRTGRSRLSAVVEEFQAHHEFPSLVASSQQGGESALSARGGRAMTTMATPLAPVMDGTTEFGALEFDRYQPLHILTRQLAEVGDDLGEVQAQVQAEIDAFRDESAGLSRTIGTLQGELTRLRMIPMSNLFHRLRMAARAAGIESSRHATVDTSGEEVSLDKVISEQIAAPLEHLIRNAFAHGFESAAERTQRSKPALGRLTIAARHSNGQVEIEIGDDGRGLDLQALRERGVAMGLVTPKVDLDSPVVRDLVFTPGLSTREHSDKLSGRGVGCDAVRRSVQRLGGSIGVRSQTGQGTTFTITLPLTLAITRVLVVVCGGDHFALPLGYIESVVDPGQYAVSEGPTGRRLNIGGAWIPLHALSDAVCPAMPATHGPMVVCRIGDRRTALIIERVRLHREVVVHSLGEMLSGHPLISGMTVGTGGELVPILDVPGVVEYLSHGQRPAVPALIVSEVGIPRILYVDDSLSVRKVAERALRDAGHAVVLAHDGEDALERVRAGGIDLIFTDLEMPRLNGLELLRAIRSEPRWAELPVIVVTSRTGEKHRFAAIAAGATDFISKPFSADQLLAVTRSLLH